MNNQRNKRAFAVVVLALVGAAGCELAVDFDRSKIDAGAGADASFPDAPGQDTSVGPDTSTKPDTGVDSSVADTSVADTSVADAADAAVADADDSG